MDEHAAASGEVYIYIYIYIYMMGIRSGLDGSRVQGLRADGFESCCIIAGKGFSLVSVAGYIGVDRNYCVLELGLDEEEAFRGNLAAVYIVFKNF